MANKQKKRYTAFIDILGFRNSVVSIEHKPELYENITAALAKLSKMNELRLGVRPKDSDQAAEDAYEKRQNLLIQTFSDCILISANDNKLGIVAVTAMSAMTYWTLFSHGFFARGAITKDDLTHDEGVVFGKALVRAYELEQKVAIFPRIILSKEVFEEISTQNLQIPVEVDFDGQPFLDIFNGITNKIINTWNEKQPDIRNYISLESGREKLIENIEIADNESIQQKLTWLKNYFNKNAQNFSLKSI